MRWIVFIKLFFGLLFVSNSLFTHRQLIGKQLTSISNNYNWNLKIDPELAMTAVNNQTIYK